MDGWSAPVESKVTSHRNSVVSWSRAVLAIALVTGLVAAVPGPAAASGGTFIDDDDSVHEADIETIAAAGFTNGCNPPYNDHYCPSDPITRGEIAAFLTRALSLPSSSTDHFDDDEDSMFESAINSLAEAGVTRGCNPPANTDYCPDESVTRGQMAALLVRAFGLTDPGQGDWFTDDDSSIFETDIDRLRQAEITAGCNPPTNSRFCPNDVVTREAMASFLVRALELDPYLPPTIQPPPALPALPENYDVTFEPGDNVAATVAGEPAGTSFYFEQGIYRLQEITPKDGDIFVGEPGAVLSGAKVLSSFRRDGDLWVASRQTQQHSNVSQGEEYGYCVKGYAACVYPEDVFIDDTPLLQVSSRSQVTAGTFYFDYATDRIYLADDPNGHLVEASATSHAFTGSADDVRIQGLIIEKYATPGREGAVNARIGRIGSAGERWIIARNEIRYNHGYAIKIEADMLIQENYLHDNGHMGLGTVADNVRIQWNEISYNCRAGFKCMGWSSGGIKLDFSDHVIVRWNEVHHNFGHGIMVDCGSVDALIEHNTVYDNEGIGIQHEISGSATIRWNDVRNNGYPIPGPGDERYEYEFQGILILNSEDSEVYENTLVGNADGLVARQDQRPRLEYGEGHICDGWYDLRDANVHDNYVELSGDATAGIDLSGISDYSYFWSKNNRFEGNDYVIDGGEDHAVFRWLERLVTAAQWVDAGQDATGTFTFR